MIDLSVLRRRLHQIPELGLDLPRTQELLLDQLRALPVDVSCGKRCSSLAVTIQGAAPGPTVLLRADMDALPITEDTGLPFASTNGNMHACGHDLHMVGLLGAIEELCARRHQFDGTVLAIFQPGEEGAHGAEVMIEEGVLLTTGQLPLASFGVHVLSFAETGQFACREGTVMAATCNFDVTIHGRGGHAARPHRALDPISVAALTIQGIQSLVAQRSSPADPIIVTVGALHAGTASNVIPDTALLRISLRAATEAKALQTYQAVVGVASGIAQAYGLRAEPEIGPTFGPTISDHAGSALVRQTVGDLFGAETFKEMLVPEMISEDFSKFLEITGGAFALVGAAVGPDIDNLATNHSSRAQFEESVIPKISRFLSEVAVRQLHQARDGG